MRILLFSSSKIDLQSPLFFATREAGFEIIEFDSIHTFKECEAVVFLNQLVPTDFSDYQDFLTALNEQCCLGKPILGIGEGADFLIELGLVPGIEDNKPCLSIGFQKEYEQNKVVHLCEGYQLNAFTQSITHKNYFPIISLPKQFIIPPALFLEMQAHGLMVFQYETHENENTAKRTASIAAISNKSGNVMAILPQLDIEAYTAIFQSIQLYVKKGYRYTHIPLYYYPR